MGRVPAASNTDRSGADTLNGMADPTFQQLRVFLVVAEELHFGRAAARLHLAQPPVSRHVKALENAVGAPLFERGREVRLTPAGVLLRGEAQALLRRWDTAAAHARDLTRTPARVLALGAIESVSLHALPAAVARLRTRHPDVAWELSEEHTDELLDGLDGARLDAAVVRGPIPPGDHRQVTLHEEELYAALPEGHRLTGPIDLADLAGEDFVVYTRRATTSGLVGTMVNACTRAGFVPRIRSEALGTELLLALVAAGDGVAMVSEVIAAGTHPGVRFVRLTGRPAVSPIVLAWRPDAPEPLIRELADLLAEF